MCNFENFNFGKEKSALFLDFHGLKRGRNERREKEMKLGLKANFRKKLCVFQQLFFSSQFQNQNYLPSYKFHSVLFVLEKKN